MGKKHEERESKKREQNRQLEMRLLIGLGTFMFGFGPLFPKKSYDYPVYTLVSLIKCSSSKVQIYSGAECKWTSQRVSLNLFFVLRQYILNGEYTEYLFS